MNDRPLKHRQVGEDKCIDIYNNGEMYEECISAQISHNYGNLIGKEPGKEPGLPVEQPHEQRGDDRDHGSM